MVAETLGFTKLKGGRYLIEGDIMKDREKACSYCRLNNTC